MNQLYIYIPYLLRLLNEFLLVTGVPFLCEITDSRQCQPCVPSSVNYGRARLITMSSSSMERLSSCRIFSLGHEYRCVLTRTLPHNLCAIYFTGRKRSTTSPPTSNQISPSKQPIVMSDKSTPFMLLNEI